MRPKLSGPLRNHAVVCSTYIKQWQDYAIKWPKCMVHSKRKWEPCKNVAILNNYAMPIAFGGLTQVSHSIIYCCIMQGQPDMIIHSLEHPCHAYNFFHYFKEALEECPVPVQICVFITLILPHALTFTALIMEPRSIYTSWMPELNCHDKYFPDSFTSHGVSLNRFIRAYIPGS